MTPGVQTPLPCRHMLMVFFFWSRWQLYSFTFIWTRLLWYWVVILVLLKHHASWYRNLVLWQNMRYCKIIECDQNLVFFTEPFPPLQPLKQGHFPTLYRNRGGIETLLGIQDQNASISTTHPLLYPNTDEAYNAMQITVPIYITYIAPAIAAMVTYALFFIWSTFLLFSDASPGPGRARAWRTESVQ